MCCALHNLRLQKRESFCGSDCQGRVAFSLSASAWRRWQSAPKCEERALIPDRFGPFAVAGCLPVHENPDGHFVIDRYPEHANVILVSACSELGFKFATVIGEIVADLTTNARLALDIDLILTKTLLRSPRETHQ